ncbi:NAD(P)-binding protein [Tothia fuscella]|uniref:NAD(P)-binding protein n=1 Tax=Tothia fuscella TaxID=1048955 RepID=A0A9P4NHC6_9PEZI|nr:NAD(P)-binding protein [Tothia fuscella]
MASKLLFITGATGFIGSHVVNLALKAGYKVRLSVRKDNQIEELKQLFPSFLSRLDFVQIPDISKIGAFDGSLSEVDFILHIASPMPGTGQDLKLDYVEPAVGGTKAILEAAKDTSTVKRVTIMSSVASLTPSLYRVRVNIRVENTELPNLVDLDMSFPEGMDGHLMKYQASKILAHEASKEFVQHYHPDFSLVTLHPTFVLGPSLLQKSRKDVSGANQLLLQSLKDDKPIFPSTCCDVRDVAQATLATIDAKVERSVEEFVISGVKLNWDQILDYVQKEYPRFHGNLSPPFDEPFVANASKAEKALRIKWRSMEDMIGSVLEQQTILAE